ncbi:hypothetical protein HYE67_009064 [Fusarium culmorum]|uniref:Uncharacterized protein n=1 Tax=Fusarium culmorum TaxID=5516 RepID=A0A7S8HZD1_FUSCU|nr:hypothetical protein HYE67_009064 [Fusarium culmorum]
MVPINETYQRLRRKYVVPILEMTRMAIEEENERPPLINPTTLVDLKARGPVRFNMATEEKNAPLANALQKFPTQKVKKKPHHKLGPETRMQVCHGDSSCHIIDFFASEDWIAQYKSTTSQGLLTFDLNIPKLKEGHMLKPWQETGARKLVNSCNLLLGGLVLGDETGLGKSLTALVAALHQRNKMLPACGPVAVITRPSCVIQWWEEIKRHFSKETRPKAIIVNTASIDVLKILEYDVIIFSSSFLKQRYREIKTLEQWCKTVESHGIETARKLFPNYQHKTIPQPLHSKRYQLMDQQFPVLIVDEAHDAKNPESLYHQAIIRLSYHNAFLLTATPIFNTWYDLNGILMLLPGSPFKSDDDFRRIFPVPPPFPSQVGRNGPEGPFLRLLQHLISGTILARPKSISDIPLVYDHHEMVKDDNIPRVIDLMIINRTITGRDLIWGKNTLHPRHPGRQNQLKRGIQLLRTSQQLANHEMLFKPYEIYEKGKEKRAETYSEFEADIQLHIQEWLDDQNARDISAPISLIDLTAEQYSQFKQWYIMKSNSVEIDKEASDSPQCLQSLKVPNQDGTPRPADINPEVLQRLTVAGIDYSRFTAEDLNMVQRVLYHDDDFNYFQDKEDLDFDPDNSESDTDTEQFAVDELGSPKVKTIAHLIANIQSEYPDGKIIVASASVKFLDIISEYLSHLLPKLKKAHFDGRITSMDDRMGIVNRFNSKTGNINLLLLSASCGGTGLNLYGGSHVIITERFWTAGLENQVIGRAARLPQEKEVHVYYIHATSAVDELIGNLLEKKKDVSHPLELAFRRADDTLYVQGLIPDRKELEDTLGKYNEARRCLYEAIDPRTMADEMGTVAGDSDKEQFDPDAENWDDSDDDDDDELNEILAEKELESKRWQLG